MQKQTKGNFTSCDNQDYMITIFNTSQSFHIWLPMAGNNVHRSPVEMLALIYFLLVSFAIPTCNGQLQFSEAQSLLSIQSLLEYPPVLRSWNNWTNFCSMPSDSSLSIICSGGSATDLSIVGNRASPSLRSNEEQSSPLWNQTLSSNFSIDSLFMTLSQLPNLKTLTLASLGLWGTLPTRISQLSSLQTLNLSSNFISGYIPRRVSMLRNLTTLALDSNMLYGPIPSWISTLPVLSVLNLSTNALNGSLPVSLGTSKSLKTLILSNNNLTGSVPDLIGLVDLEVLDLGWNLLGPHFPAIGDKVVILSLQRNMFTFNIPPRLASFNQLQKFDISSNRFVGPLLLSLFSLPSIRYLNLRDNKFTGVLPSNMRCNGVLRFVDISNNLLMGNSPPCVGTNGSNKTILYSGNCLNNTSEYQHQYSFCSNPALAAIPPPLRRRTSPNKLLLLLGVAGGIVICALLLAFLILIAFRRCKKTEIIRHHKYSTVTAPAVGFPPKLLTNAKYISQTMSLAPLVMLPYRIFTIEELEEATDHFDSSSFVEEGPEGQLYVGKLKDGSMVSVRRFRLTEKHTLQSLMQYIEPLSRLRHRYVVNTLGHCIGCCTDTGNVEMVYLVFEFISNGSLSSHLYGVRTQEALTWQQRVSTALGVARGVKFLHSGVVPGVFGNDLKAENVLLDHNLTPKISKYNLPMPSRSVATKVGNPFPRDAEAHPARVEDGEKLDVYRLGVILLELIVGRQISLGSEIELLKSQVYTNSIADADKMREAIDPSIRSCSYGSIRTVVDITIKCLSQDPSARPSVEDVIWNLQYAAQVQDGSTTNSHADDYSDLRM